MAIADAITRLLTPAEAEKMTLAEALECARLAAGGLYRSETWADAADALVAFFCLPVVDPHVKDRRVWRGKSHSVVRGEVAMLAAYAPAHVARIPAARVAEMFEALPFATIGLVRATAEGRQAHAAVLVAGARHADWQVTESALHGLAKTTPSPEIRAAVDAARDHSVHVVRRAAERAWRPAREAGPLTARDVAARLRIGHYRRYAYVGPERIRLAAVAQPRGTRIESPDELRAWSRSNPGAETGATYVVDGEGALRIAPRHSEHVACAGGGPVLGAGEIHVRGEVVTAITNQSTGYCPEPRCWPAVADALAGARLRAPTRWSHAFHFRRCGCGQINLVKDGVFLCDVCDRDLPREWNFGRS